MLCSRTPPWLKALVRCSAECRPARKPAPLPVRPREIRGARFKIYVRDHNEITKGQRPRVATNGVVISIQTAIERIVGHPECAGINRHVVGDERAVVGSPRNCAREAGW